MKSSFDTKNLIIIVISIVAIFLLISYFYGSSGYKKVIKMYEEKALELEKRRDELRDQVEYFKEEARKDSIEAAAYDLQVQREKKKETEKKIDDLSKNPIIRKGDSLIESLKEKTDQK
jgi:cell division protein FtsB